MSYCKVCQKDREKLIRCHIYPRSLTLEAAGETGELVAMRVVDGKGRASPALAGIYDDAICCAGCERLFEGADRYAIEFRRRALYLRGDYSFPNKLDGSRFPQFKADASLLHTFAMTTLFRAILSDRSEHQAAKSPAIEQEVRASREQAFRTIDSGRDVLLIVTTGPLGGLAASPVLLGAEGFGHPVFAVQMPNFQIVIAASDAGLPPEMREARLIDGQPVTVWRRRRPLDEELEAAKEAVVATDAQVERIFRAMRRKPART